MTKIDTGFIDVGEQETDLLLDGEAEIPVLFNQDEIIYSYNQGKSKDCTIYSSVGAISDLMNYEFSPEEITELNELSYQAGRIRGKGWLTQSAVKLVCKRWNNKFPERKVVYFRIDVKSNLFYDAIVKGYSTVISIKGNSDYVLDYSKDGVVDGKEFKPITYGHATDSRKVNGTTGVKDSYKGRTYNKKPTNEYSIKYMSDLVDNGNIYPNAYLILPEEKSKISLEDLKRRKEMELQLKQQIDGNSKLWYQTDVLHSSPAGEFSRDWLTECNNILRLKLSQVQEMLKAF